jgi:hypothetical protein
MLLKIVSSALFKLVEQQRCPVRRTAGIVDFIRIIEECPKGCDVLPPKGVGIRNFKGNEDLFIYVFIRSALPRLENYSPKLSLLSQEGFIFDSSRKNLMFDN